MLEGMVDGERRRVSEVKKSSEEIIELIVHVRVWGGRGRGRKRAGTLGHGGWGVEEGIHSE